MNVLNRKMFANRDARRKLANMGGILASSPELMNTAQMFANGGQSSVPGFVPFKTKTVIMGDPKGGTLYDLYSDGSAILVSTGTRIDPNNASNQTFLQMLQRLPDVTNTSISQPEEETNIPKLDTTPILNQPLQDEPTTVEPTMDEDYTPTAAELDQELLDMGAPDKRFDVVPNAIDRVYGDMGDLDKRDAEGPPGEVKRGDKRETKTVPEDPKSIFEILGIGEGTGPGVSATRRKSNKNQQLTDEEQEFEASPTDEDMVTDETLLELEEVATGEGTSEEKTEKIREKIFGPGVDSQTAIAQYQTKFNDILGEDRDLNEEKWHTLAMIGFAIAAGEDSNALTNIANGLLEGTKMAREDRATRQARKDKINMLALEQFFADKRLREEIKGRKDVAQIRADASTADDTWFDTAQGKNAIAAYRDIFGTQNVSMKEEDKMPAFIKRVGEDSATVFFTLMNIPREETQTDTRTLDDIPDKKVKKSEQNK
tara:strand:- start:4639 stop:6093 length:1455 start_codon:yes stop_codon:yes gene_type:complete